MSDNTSATLQIVWEQLNGALYDLTAGNAADAIPAIEDCIERIESLQMEPLK